MPCFARMEIFMYNQEQTGVSEHHILIFTFVLYVLFIFGNKPVCQMQIYQLQKKRRGGGGGSHLIVI